MAPGIHQELKREDALTRCTVELSIVIVNWRSADYLEHCLASIESNVWDLDYEIIVIDSGSFDGCDKMLREKFPWVRFIQSETNLGFARANNEAFKVSTGPLVLFLNPDTEIVGSAIQTLAERLRSTEGAGLVGCKLLNSDRSIQVSCVQAIPTILNQMLDSEWLRVHWPDSRLWGSAAVHANDSQPQQVEAISGACVMVKREVFEQVGMFSEEYFMYTEDIDLSYEVERLGYRNYFVPDATVVHHGGGSSEAAPSQFATVWIRESTWQFLTKRRGLLYGWGYRAAMGLSALARISMLGLFCPVQHLRGRGVQWHGSLHKWLTVLYWSLSRKRMLARIV